MGNENDNNREYFDFMRLIIAHKDLSPSHKLVALNLHDRQGKKGFAFPAIPTICEDCNLGRTSVIAGIQKLELLGVLEVERPDHPHSGQSNRYRIDRTSLKFEPVRNSNQSEIQTRPVRNLNQTSPKFELEPVRNLNPNVPLNVPLNETKTSHSNSPQDSVSVDQEFMDHWNRFSNLPRIKTMTGGRKRNLKVRMKEPDFRENWKTVVCKLSRSAFHTGNNDRGWKANVDWILKNDQNYLKILELEDRPDPLDASLGTRDASDEDIRKLKEAGVL